MGPIHSSKLFFAPSTVWPSTPAAERFGIEFIADYQAEWNRLQGERHAAASQRDRQLANVQRRIAGIVEAIERGIITPTTKQRLEELEAQNAHLEALPVEAALPAIHPNLARLYRDKVARLEEELADPEIAAEARLVPRSLIKTIKVTPGAKRGEVTLELHGELAAILAAGQAKRNKDGTLVAPIQVSVVCGIGFEPTRGLAPTSTPPHAIGRTSLGEIR